MPRPESELRALARKSALRENLESIIVAVLFAWFVRSFIAQPYKIPSGSMEDSLLIGDHLVVNKVAYGEGADRDGWPFLPTRQVRRGDVIIFRPPHDDTQDFIKRVVGLPGETLTLTFSPERNGVRVAVDGKALSESFRVGHFQEPRIDDAAEWTVTYAGMPPELRYGWLSRTFILGNDEYFVMGDNRNDSLDSRFWEGSYGVTHAVKAERIRGLAWFIYWSYDVGDADPEPRGFGKKLAHYGRIAATFFTRTRWNRSFQEID